MRLYFCVALVLAAISEPLLLVPTLQDESTLKLGRGYGVNIVSFQLSRLGLPKNMDTWATSSNGTSGLPVQSRSAVREHFTNRDFPLKAEQSGITFQRDYRNPTSSQQLDLRTAEALIRAPRLSTITTRRKSPPLTRSQVSQHQFDSIAGAFELSGSAVPTSTCDLETSSAPPPVKSTIDGRRTLLGMTAGLAVVCFIFMVWM